MKANEYYNMQRTRALAALDRRREQIERAAPEVSDLLLQKQRLFKDRAATLARPPAVRPATVAADSSVREIDEQIARCNQNIAAILNTLGYDPAFLELTPLCPLCGDTGFCMGKPCSCFLQPQQNDTFDQFDVSLFPEGAQRKQAAELLRFGQSYAQAFPKNERPNLLISGSTGLGKTFFLDCILSHVHARGFVTANLSAYQLIQSIMNGVINKSDYSYLRRLENIPLLVLDDLGSEPFIPNITVEYMFSLINERFRANRPTLIATNLTAGDISARYGARISSRLFDTKLTRAIKLNGKDLRTIKKPAVSSD